MPRVAARYLSLALIAALAVLCVGCGASGGSESTGSTQGRQAPAESPASSRAASAALGPGAVLEEAARAYARKDFTAYCGYLSPAARRRLISEAEKGKSCAGTIEALRGPPGDTWLRESDEAELQAAAELRVSDERPEGNYAVVTTIAHHEAPSTHTRALVREHGRWLLARSIFVESGGTNEEPE